MTISRFVFSLAAASMLLCQFCMAQDATPAEAKPATAAASEILPAVLRNPDVPAPDKRAYGVLPNYRTAEADAPWSPITWKQKMTIARKDSLDGPSYIMAGFFAGVSQLTGSNASFGQGVKGYARRYASGIADQDLGNFLTEGILPSVFHQDPRYFRKGHGSAWSRIAYAASRSAVAKTDSGHWTFNASEFLGNGMVASIGNAYYPDDVGFKPTMQRMFTQIGTDTISQVLKEFWPDVKRKLVKRKSAGTGMAAGDE